MIEGPKLPFRVSKSAMASNYDGNGVILVGGWNYDAGKESDVMLEYKLDKWRTLDDTLRFGRQYPLALSLPFELTSCGMIHRMVLIQRNEFHYHLCIANIFFRKMSRKN